MRRVPILAIVGAAALAVACPSCPADAAGQEGEGPARCRVGAFLASVHDLDPAAGTFGAELWLWSVCPPDGRRPLETMEFPNADEIETRLDATTEREGAVWATRKVRGTFRHAWDERNFPFDQQTLEVVLEEGVEDADAFAYEPDAANSGYDPAIALRGWRITDFAVRGDLARYATTFGDPARPAGTGSAYSRLTLGLSLDRAGPGGFLKLTAVAYAAFLLSLVTYAMHLESVTALSPRTGVLAAALFSTAVNLAAASAALGGAGGVTLVDKVHAVVIAYVLAATGVTVASRLLVERGWSPPAIARLNRRAAAAAAASFVAVNALLVAVAARAG